MVPTHADARCAMRSVQCSRCAAVRVLWKPWAKDRLLVLWWIPTHSPDTPTGFHNPCPSRAQSSSPPPRPPPLPPTIDDAHRSLDPPPHRMCGGVHPLLMPRRRPANPKAPTTHPPPPTLATLGPWRRQRSSMPRASPNSTCSSGGSGSRCGQRQAAGCAGRRPGEPPGPPLQPWPMHTANGVASRTISDNRLGSSGLMA